jgi:ParB-like chromosome segregation protein Spo0J
MENIMSEEISRKSELIILAIDAAINTEKDKIISLIDNYYDENITPRLKKEFEAKIEAFEVTKNIIRAIEARFPGE